jgi:hypothetical protein
MVSDRFFTDLETLDPAVEGQARLGTLLTDEFIAGMPQWSGQKRPMVVR